MDTKSVKDPLNISLPADLRKCRRKALEYTEFGSLEGREKIRVDHKTVIFRKIKNIAN